MDRQALDKIFNRFMANTQVNENLFQKFLFRALLHHALSVFIRPKLT